MTLTAEQQSVYHGVLGLAGTASFGSALLHGRPNCGKRLLCRLMADELGLDIIPIDASRPQAELKAEFEKYTEDLGTDSAFVLVDNLNRLNRENEGVLQTLCQYKRFGMGASLSEDSVVVGLHHTASSPREIGLTHPALAAFRHRVPLGGAVTLNDLAHLLRAECDAAGVALVNELELLSELDLDPVLVSPGTCATFCRDVIALAARSGVTALAAREASRRAWNRWLSKMAYRGQTLTLGQYELWLSQFSDEERPLLASVARALVDTYYVDEASYWELIDTLIAQSAIPRYDNVVFCSWQDQGESAPQVARDLKGRALWNVVGEVHLDSPETWRVAREQSAAVVLVDDFVGSGEQLSGALTGFFEAASQLVDIPFVVALLCGFEEGVAHALETAGPLPGNVRIVRARGYSARDSCLSGNSEILPSETSRKALESVSDRVGRLVGLRSSRRIGWGGLAALVVFPRFLPNAVLPLIWFDSKPTLFHPLIARSGHNP